MERGHTIKVLDHGYVTYIDSMGSDEDIVSAARMSTGRGFISWEPYKRCKRCEKVSLDALGGEREVCSCGCDEWNKFPRGDFGMLEYLYKNRHTTPFEMCELVIDVQVPMDTWRQWIRHRTANVNEYSTRYSKAIDLMAETSSDAWRTQGVTNRQGSGAFLAGVKSDPYGAEAPGVVLSMREAELHALARQVYEERLAAGVAKEQARKDLPLSTYTAARWKCDLKNLLHFLGLRMHGHAQIEIRTYANAVAEIVKEIWPRTFALFEEHDLHGAHLSAAEVKFLRDYIRRGPVALDTPIHQSVLKKLGCS